MKIVLRMFPVDEAGGAQWRAYDAEYLPTVGDRASRAPYGPGATPAEAVGNLILHGNVGAEVAVEVVIFSKGPRP